ANRHCVSDEAATLQQCSNSFCRVPDKASLQPAGVHHALPLVNPRSSEQPPEQPLAQLEFSWAVTNVA
ncbi:hypothetical protein E2320_022349, partial [Naja naja]